MIARVGSVLLACGSFAVLVGGAADLVDAEVSRHVLANGMRVIVRESHTTQVVAIPLQVDAAVRPETEATAGITQFLHQAMLRGTSRRSAVQIAEAADDLGGALEAAGDADHGEIRGHALARQWQALLALLIEVALEPSLPAAGVAVQRRLVLSEIRRREDTPFTVALDTALRGLFGARPYAWPSVGRRASIEAITRNALVAYHQALYRPEHLVLAVSGDIDSRRVISMVERRFGALRPTGSATVEPVGERLTRGADRMVLEHPAHQAQIVVAFQVPSARDPDHPATKVLGALIGGGLSSRLFVEIRERQGLAYSVGALSPTKARTGYLVTYVRTSPETAEAAERELRTALDRIRAGPPSEDEVARARAYVLGAQAMDRRTNARHAWYLAFYELIGAGWEFADRYADAVARVTPADVAAAARRYLGQSTTVVLLPPR